MNKAYNKIVWQNKPSTATPLNQTNLNEMSNALDTIDDRVIALDSGKVSSVTVTNTLQTGDTIATITVDGTPTAIKAPLVEVDDELSTSSTNPVQNKIITEALREIMPEETVTGNPISITDGSNVVPAKQAEVTLLPIQDLHGQSAPYPAGGGKNKCPEFPYPYVADNNFVEYPTEITFHGMTLSFTFSGSFSIKSAAFILGYDENNSPTYVKAIYNWVKVSDGTSIEENVTYTNERFRFSVSDSVTVKKFVLTNYPSFSNGTKFENVQIEEGNQVTTFAPYSNICPITGRNSVKVKRTGKNLMSPLVKGVGLIGSTGAEQVSATSATTDYIPIKFTEDVPYYYISGLSNQINSFIYGYNANKQGLGRTAGNARTSIMLDKNFINGGGTPQCTGEIAYIRISQFVITGQTATIDVVDSLTPQLEIGQTATTYEPYQGETYTETLGQTVYGGNVDFVSGEGQNDYEYLNPTSVAAVAQSGGLYYCIINSGIHSYNNANVISSHFVKGSLALGKCYITGGGTTLVFVNPDQTITTKEQANIWLQNNNVQFAIPLATSQTLTLTPTQIALLKGNNVVSTDGDNINLVYSADIALFIQNQLQS